MCVLISIYFWVLSNIANEITTKIVLIGFSRVKNIADFYFSTSCLKYSVVFLGSQYIIYQYQTPLLRHLFILFVHIFYWNVSLSHHNNYSHGNSFAVYFYPTSNSDFAPQNHQWFCHAHAGSVLMDLWETWTCW